MHAHADVDDTVQSRQHKLPEAVEWWAGLPARWRRCRPLRSQGPGLLHVFMRYNVFHGMPQQPLQLGGGQAEKGLRAKSGRTVPHFPTPLNGSLQLWRKATINKQDYGGYSSSLIMFLERRAHPSCSPLRVSHMVNRGEQLSRST